MKKSNLSLEVICHRENKKDEKLVFENNIYKTKPIVNRVHMNNEGILANIENQKVDLFNKLYNDLTLPTDVDAFSLVVVKNEIYTSEKCSIIKPISSKEIARVGTNLYAYESKSSNVFIVNKEDLVDALKFFSLLSYQYITEREERKSNNERFKTYNEVFDMLNDSINHNYKVHNIIIKNNTFRVTGFIEENEKFNNDEELRSIINNYLSNSRYNRIVLVKIVYSNSNKPKYTKVGEYEFNLSNYDALILSEKQYLSILRDEIKNINNNVLVKKLL